MSQTDLSRRCFLKAAGLGSAAAALSPTALSGQADARATGQTIQIDPTPTFDLSPYLYMQFMEPLGTTDSSVDAAWDFGADRWREDVVEITQVLAPTLMRWGGRAGKPMADGETILEYGDGLADYVVRTQTERQDLARVAATEMRALSGAVSSGHYAPETVREQAGANAAEHWERLRSYLRALRRVR